METLKRIFNTIQIFIFTLVVGYGGQQLGLYQADLKYKAVEIEDTQKNTFIESEKLKTEAATLKQEVKENQVKLVPTQIVSVKKYYLLLKHGDGRYELRTGGNPSWRYNNPGKLLYGNFAKMVGAVGKDGPLAIFPDYETGHAALEAYVFESDVYKGLTVSQFVTKFAKSEDGYDTKKYLANLLKSAKFKSTTALSSMTADDRADLIDGIQEQENWTAGNIRMFEDQKAFEKDGY